MARLQKEFPVPSEPISSARAEEWFSLMYAVAHRDITSDIAIKVMQKPNEIKIDFKGVRAWNPQIKDTEMN